MGTLSVDKLVKTSAGAAEFTLPATDGTAGQVWQTDGAGQLSVGAYTIPTDAVDTAQIAALAVDTAEIAANAVDGTKIAMGSDAAGDILYYNGTDYVRLPKGTAAQQLAVNSGATAPEWVAVAAGGKIAQVITSTKTDTFTTSNTTYTDITDLTVDITPSATSSKVLVFANFNVGNNTNDRWSAYQLVRDSTAISIGDTAGSRTRASTSSVRMTATGSANRIDSLAINYIDSPSTTSSTTYKIQCKTQSSSTLTVNRSGSDTDADYSIRSVSTITVMEVLV